MLACVQNTVNEGEETHALMLKRWDDASEIINAKLDKTSEVLEKHSDNQRASYRDEVLDSLIEMKHILENRVPEKESSAKK